MLKKGDKVQTQCYKHDEKVHKSWEEDRCRHVNTWEINLSKKLISSHNYNESGNKEKLLEYLSSGSNVGLVSDRGTPIISDPGYILVKEAIKNNFNVVCLPGATAFVPGLVTSGLDNNHFTFYGFLNSKESKRKTTAIAILMFVKMGFKFFGKKNAIVKDGTFDVGTNQGTCDLLYPFLEGCLRYVKDGALEEWERGDGNEGMLTMNRGIQAVIRVINFKRVDLPTLGIPSTIAKRRLPVIPLLSYLSILSFKSSFIAGSILDSPSPVRQSTKMQEELSEL